MDIDVNGYTHEHMQEVLIDMFPQLLWGRDYIVGHPLNERTGLQNGLPYIVIWRSTEVKQPDNEAVHAYFKLNEAKFRAIFARKIRNEALLGSDPRVMTPPDVPAELAKRNIDAWKVYRQALRDIPNQKNWPFNIIWPERPTNLFDLSELPK
jgi:hypothetical protein